MNPAPENEFVISPAVIKPRELKRARQLAWMSPGLGHMYLGLIVRGFWFQAGVALPAAVGAWMLMGLWKDPMLALIPLFIAYCIQIWSVRDVTKLAHGTRPDYRLKDYNTIPAYMLSSTVPSFATAMAISLGIIGYIGDSYRIGTDLPAAGVLRGDVVAMSKLAYRTQGPAAGDTVIYRSKAQGGEDLVGHVEALAGQTVNTADGKTIIVPEESLWIARKDLPDGGAVFSSYAIKGKITFRVWPLTRAGKVSAPGAANL